MIVWLSLYTRFLVRLRPHITFLFDRDRLYLPKSFSHISRRAVGACA